MGGFRKFLLRGNVISLAVAVMIGGAFNSVVQKLIADLITPLISAVGKLPNFANLTLHVGESTFRYGDFINAVIAFLVMAAVVYYVVVLPSNRLTALATRKQEATERACPDCTSMIPVAAKRCKFCTAEVPPYVPEQSASQPTIVDRLRPILPPRSR